MLQLEMTPVFEVTVSAEEVEEVEEVTADVLSRLVWPGRHTI